jgi:hypothetical protein
VGAKRLILKKQIMANSNLNNLILAKTSLEYDIKDLITKFLYNHKDLNFNIGVTVNIQKFELCDDKIVSVPIVKIKITL